MDWYESIRACYNWGCYSKNDVKVFVMYNKITESQYEEIVQEDIVTAD
ncbi:MULTISPECIES: XkdX family protein [Bacillus]|nr:MULTISPECIES: XkdX family protein [Bacillus]MDN0191153.1 XkdX family protein [Bacillus sp. B.PNR1]MDN3032059.1 XkdX family protein [Bacillus sp. B.PNR2]UUI85580.1 XkdX family protein [Bacillus halotolerans]